MKKALSLILSIIMILSALPVAAIAEQADTVLSDVKFQAESGTTGDCTWSVSGSTLTISGNGKMADYEDSSVPWSKSITKVVIANGVTYVGKYAFFDHTSLTSVDIASSVTGIGGGAFSSCTALKNVSFPDSITEVGSYAMSGSAWLDSQPSGVVYIGKVAYTVNGTCPESITIKDGTLGIAEGAFYWKSALKSITLPTSLTTIGDNAFYGTSISSITIPKNVSKIMPRAFASCSNLTSINMDAANPFYKFKNNCIIETQTKTLVQAFNGFTIPTDGSVTTIGSNSFSSLSLSSVTIPEGITTIRSNAFATNFYLTSVDFPSSLRVIESEAFDSCSSLRYVTLPEGVTTLGEKVFSNLSSIELPSTLTSYENAFKGSSNLSEVIFAPGLKVISARAFENCYNLDAVEFPASLTTIGEDAFKSCSDLESVTIASLNDWLEIKFISSFSNPLYSGADLIIGGKTVTSVSIPAAFSSVGSYAFCGYAKLTEVTLPSTLTEIGQGAFMGCTGLTSMSLPSGMKKINPSTFSGCSSLAQITVPNSVKEFGSYAFYNCSALDHINIPEGTTLIDRYSFANSGLAKVTIPTSITKILANSFSNCTALKTLVLHGGITEIEGYAFDRTQNIKDIYYEGRHYNEIGYIGYNNPGLGTGTWHYNACLKNTSDFTHAYSNEADLTCNHCGKERTLFTPGDLDGTEGVTSADAIYLLYYTLFGEARYPVDQPVDFDKNGAINSADAIYLLYHTLFGSGRYPLA